jgi:Protein of unknown function DUF84
MTRDTELGIAIDQYAGALGIRDGEGAWGILSGGLISRQESFRLAVIAGFAPFYTSPPRKAINRFSKKSCKFSFSDHQHCLASTSRRWSAGATKRSLRYLEASWLNLIRSAIRCPETLHLGQLR